MENKNNKKKKRFLSTSELADILGISRVAVYKKIKKGQIEAQKVAGNYLIDKEDLGGILDEELTEDEKNEIEKIVDKVVEDYGETLKLLAQE